jgi:hypothetical protein
MQRFYEYGAIPFEEILQLIDEMQKNRMQYTMPITFEHAVALLVPDRSAR